MKDRIVRIEEKQLRDRAACRFSQICGLTACGEQAAAVLESGAGQVYQTFLAGRGVRGILRSFDRTVFQRGALTIAGERIACGQFSRIAESSVRRVYLYCLTASEQAVAHGAKAEKKFPAEPMEQLYLDMWETAFLDSARDVLRESILQTEALPGGKPLFLRETGPGFYGMPLEEAAKLAALLETGRIGVSLGEGFTLRPEKSCLGLYLVLDRDFVPEAACASCLGNDRGCDFCQRKERENQR